MCKAPVRSSPPTNQHPTFHRPDALPVIQLTASKHWRVNKNKSARLQVLNHYLIHSEQVFRLSNIAFHPTTTHFLPGGG